MTASAARRVTLLTQDDCAFCEHAKDVLRRVAADTPLDIEELGVGTERGGELARRSGLLFAPGVFVDGRFVSHGRLSEKKLRRALAAPR